MKEHYISKRYGRIIHIWDAIYKMTFWYFDVPDLKAVKKIASKYSPDEFTVNSQVGKFSPLKIGAEDEIGIIWAKENKPHLLAHECLHATLWLMQKRGVSVSLDSDEVITYHMAFLIEEIYKHVKIKTAPPK